MPELVASRGLRPGGLGVALGVLAAASILSLSAAGAVADRIGRRTLACAGAAGIGAALVLLAALEARAALLPTVALLASRTDCSTSARTRSARTSSASTGSA